MVDYATSDATRSGTQYDVIFDIAGVSSFRRSCTALRPRGRYLTLFLTLGALWHTAITALTGGRRARFAIALPTPADMEAIRDLVGGGAIRPTIAQRLPLDRVADAHRAAETRGVHGTVVVTMGALARPAAGRSFPIPHPAGPALR